ncbi:MAG: CPBP family intramembrane metalloprotease [Lachnospiraceae bacterium]|nr:CPBP family intramembrane metalloprotease [Lachnospiraceae bacterium]MBD5505491.1 CPBP family intramembrane metalloprotease [Lachnospiraceae bacterium]
MPIMNSGHNNHWLNRMWEIFCPFLFFFVFYSVIFILLVSLCRAIAGGLGEEYQAGLTKYAETVTSMVSGLSMLIAVLPLLPMLRRELKEHKLSVYGNSTTADNKSGSEKRAGSGKYGITVVQIVLTIVLAAASSLGLNVLLALTGIVESSASYQDVARQQYSVMLGAGMILFGLISPIAEEIVFRGLVFNRMRRYFPHAAAIVASGVLFGIYHGNPVQGLYGGCMGILMAYLYERMHSFVIPCLFHAIANLMVYSVAQSAALHEMLFTVPGCAALLAGSAVCVVIIETERRKKCISKY